MPKIKLQLYFKPQLNLNWYLQYYCPVKFKFEKKQYLNCREDAPPHRDLASSNQDLGVLPSRVERRMSKGKIASQD